jgi:hypothetical protein
MIFYVFPKNYFRKNAEKSVKNEKFTKMDFLRPCSDSLFFSVWHCGNIRFLFLAVFGSHLSFLLLPVVESS